MSNRTSKITYVSLNAAVCVALNQIGVSSAKVLASVNCAIGRAQLDTTKTKAGEAKFSTKTDFASIKETETATFVSKEPGLVFLAFHDAEVKMQKMFGAREVTIPRQFIPWLEKHKITLSNDEAKPTESAPVENPTEVKPADLVSSAS
jgi:hypothetical protein